MTQTKTIINYGLKSLLFSLYSARLIFLIFALPHSSVRIQSYPKQALGALNPSLMACRIRPRSGFFLPPVGIRSMSNASAGVKKGSGIPWLENLPVSEAAEPAYWPPKNNVKYDWNTPTFEIYDEAEIGSFAPSFAKARERLDYSYHHNLALKRQHLQDAIIRRVVNSSAKLPKEKRPWIVFTAGAMGVGKGYVISNLNNAGLFPLDSFLKIDPDLLKQELPELSGYLRQDKQSAATKVHRESTQMSDVLFEYALLNEIPLLVDGSLRDVNYYQTLFDRIREKHPQYRIAIIHVIADRDLIHERAKERAKRTGRTVPKDLLNESIEQVPRSVEILSKKVDALHVISNNDGSPLKLESAEIRDENAHAPTSWIQFAKSWDYFDNHEIDGDSSPVMECKMGASWDDPEAHAAATAVWGKAYPNFCARCAMACDGQCGICVHGKHLCGCDICR
jgi:hypothetical protein